MTITASSLEALRTAPNLEALYRELDPMDLTPGWIPREKPLLSPQPITDVRVNHWQYSQVKAALDAAGRLINTQLAERRNLVLLNSPEGAGVSTVRTLVGAYQMILPGEKARSHRHAPHALRVIIDARGSFSVVDGEKTPMESGDVVLTPGWCWHGHGHDGDQPAYWFDGLDVPLTWQLEPMFYEDHPATYEPVTSVVRESPFRFTWESIQRGLEAASPDAEGCFAKRIQLEAPSMPTIGLFVQRLDGGQATRRYRATAHQIFVVMEGRGESTIEGQTLAWSRGDSFAVPVWHGIEHRAGVDATLFAMSDEPLMRYAKYWRFQAD